MITLFQVSTLTSWSTVAYTSMYGCSRFEADPYSLMRDGEEQVVQDSRIVHTMAGRFQAYICNTDEGKPVAAFIFFTMFILLNAWVISETTPIPKP